MSAPTTPTIPELANGGPEKALAEMVRQARRIEDAVATGGMAADTGWVANASAGDKTVVVPAYTPVAFGGTDGGSFGSTFNETATALSVLSGTMELLVKKVQALETALAANLRPNA